MKKIYLSFFLAFLGLSLSLVSCDAYDDDNQKAAGSEAFLFLKTSSNLAASNSEVSYVDVEVGVTTSSSSDRTYNISIDPSSTADISEYTIDQSTLVIPAGSYTGTFRISANYNNIPASGSTTLVINLDEDNVVVSKEVHTVTLFRYCATDLAGNYSVTTTYGYHDFLPAYSTNTMSAAVTQVGDNTYKVLDFSGGLYSTGPYASNYGTGSAGQAANRDLTFSVNCGAITWSGETDPWGTMVPTSGAVNSYDPNTGVITISWTCNGYGEYGVSVYTPL